MKISRRKIQIVLGSLWLLDGLLQLQPHMFTKDFVTQVIQPAQAGQPFYIYDPIHLGIRIFLTHPAVFNSLIALIQISIGLLILNKRTVKYGLWFSVAWGLFVWYAGEAAAGIFSGTSSLAIGLPGAALLYAIISLGVLPKKDDKKQPADSWLAFVWAGVWVLGAIFNLLPTQNSTTSLKAAIIMSSSGGPSWLVHVDTSVANFLNHFGALPGNNMASMMMPNNSGYLPMLILSVAMLAIGLSVFMRRRYRQPALVLGIILSLLFWVAGQGLGGYWTGTMTDVQAAPLLILLGLAVFSQADLDLRMKRAYIRLEKVLV